MESLKALMGKSSINQSHQRVYIIYPYPFSRVEFFCVKTAVDSWWCLPENISDSTNKLNKTWKNMFSPRKLMNIGPQLVVFPSFSQIFHVESSLLNLLSFAQEPSIDGTLESTTVVSTFSTQVGDGRWGWGVKGPEIQW